MSNKIGLNTLTAEGIRDTARIGWDVSQIKQADLQNNPPNTANLVTEVSLLANTLSAIDTGYKAIGAIAPELGRSALMGAAAVNKICH